MSVSRSKGFTLVELSVTLVIVGLLLAAAMIPLSAQVDLRNIADTRRSLEQIKEAIIGFAQANGRLPCPATGTIASGASGAGVESVSSNACSSAFGVLPWATLGVPETDAWGRRFSYAVAPAFGDENSQNTWATSYDLAPLTSPLSLANQSPGCTPSPTPSAPATFALCSLGDIAVLNPTDANKSPTSPVSQGAPVVILSHGKNGYGAYQSNGLQLSGTGGGHESANLGGGIDSSTLSGLSLYFKNRVFYTRAVTSQSSDCSETDTSKSFCEFDDILVWIPPFTLVARMVSAGRLP
ncbi:MAG: hypothetical protein A3H32_06655 [Betaproteobacteria bacterium RIFCSPLOWO2_02_FULL_63_19]|nr:MAG: hypothetical protein A3H32_06655 [Betaproteobacteria bacterium RIFCSPLOWO2_02_FULL_63_19]